MHKDSPHLDAQYAGFGKVIEGLDVVDAIASVKTGRIGYYMADVPRESVVIESIRVVE
jgi:peptidyl-prolyl cis-trans isomerase B (cyclophilin B)